MFPLFLLSERVCWCLSVTYTCALTAITTIVLEKFTFSAHFISDKKLNQKRYFSRPNDKEEDTERKFHSEFVIGSYTRGRRIGHLQGFLRSLVQLLRNFNKKTFLLLLRLITNIYYLIECVLFLGLLFDGE